MDSNVVSLSNAAGAGAPVALPRAAPPAVPTTQEADPQGSRPAPTPSFLTSGGSGDVPGAMKDTYARFVVDPETHDVHVEIIDASKHEVVRTIPGDDLRRMAQNYRSNGIVLDSTA